MKEAKQPWPRSAKITVWVLGIIIAASAIVNIITISQWYGPYQKWSDKCDSVKYVTAQDSCDMRDRLLRYFATCCQEKPLSGSLKRG